MTKVAERIEKLSALLVQDERIECYAVQRRICALTHRRMVFACTSGRLVIMRPNILPGYQTTDIRWQDLKDAHLQERILGSTVTIRTAAMTARVTGLCKDEAQKVYRFCQEQEQSWREKNRVREMEEERAKAGGVVIGSPSGTVSTESAPGSGADDAKERLRKAKAMLDEGLITDAEFETTKAKILSSL